MQILAKTYQNHISLAMPVFHSFLENPEYARNALVSVYFGLFPLQICILFLNTTVEEIKKKHLVGHLLFILSLDPERSPEKIIKLRSKVSQL